MKNVQDIYTLSPMQEVMLMHATTRRSDDVLFNQFCYEIRGRLDRGAFEQAWRQIVARHEILRTAFLWEDLKSPIQVVRQRIDVPFAYSDWSADPEPTQAQRLEQFREADRQRGFDPRKAPLMRFALMRRGEDSHYFVWSSHHLLLDRWCLRSLFEEFFEHYHAAFSDAAPDHARHVVQYREYIKWLKQQDESKAQAYWQSALGGLSSATPLTRVARDTPCVDSHFRLARNEVDALRQQARSAGVTLSVLMQAGWSLLLNRLTGRQDVLFGTVVAGRPLQLAGVESIIGSFVNNVPTRVRLPVDVSLGDWLKTLQQVQHERTPFEYASPMSIQRWSDLPVGEPMFDTLIVTLGQTGVPGDEVLEFLPFEGEVTTAYPLTLSVDEADSSLTVIAHLHADRQCEIPLDDLMSEFASVLNAVATAPLDAATGDLPDFRGLLTSADQLVSEARLVSESSADYGAVATQGGRQGEDIRIIMDLLRTEWQSALGRSDFGPHDDFFRLGGSSLQAANLHARIEAATRVSLPMLALFRSTTLHGMAETIADGDWPLRSDLAIGLRTTGTRPPLFCIASPEVNAVGYALLARYLDDDQPVYVLQAPPSDGAVRRLSPMELPEVAAKYLEDIRRIQPDGPYHLLGMCVGSQLAVEIANQLDSMGERAAFAGVINTWALYTVSRRYRLQQVFNTISWYARRLRDIVRLRPREALPVVRGIIQRRLAGLLSQTAPRPVRRAGLSAASNPSGAPATISEVESVADEKPKRGDPWIEEFGWTHKDPRNGKYRGTVTVFRQRFQPFWRTGDRDLGWGRHVMTTNVVRLPGLDHLGILREPVVQVMAKCVAEQLEFVQGEESK